MLYEHIVCGQNYSGNYFFNLFILIVTFFRPKNRKEKMEGDHSDKENKREEQNIKKKKRARSSSSGSSSSRYEFIYLN